MISKGKKTLGPLYPAERCTVKPLEGNKDLDLDKEVMLSVDIEKACSKAAMAQMELESMTTGILPTGLCIAKLNSVEADLDAAKALINDVRLKVVKHGQSS